MQKNPQPMVDHSLKNLGKLYRKRVRRQRRDHFKNVCAQTRPQPPEPEMASQALFLSAMRDVVPLDRTNCPTRSTPQHRRKNAPALDVDDEVRQKLKQLIRTGAGFNVAQTPEYVEGIAPCVHPRVIDQLLAGKFAIQDHLNLRGLHLAEAQTRFDDFMENSLRAGHRLVLIVHGRGLCSPNQPILKTNLTHWLSRTRWRKKVLAFCSARNFDGGAGATYVLLRRCS